MITEIDKQVYAAFPELECERLLFRQFRISDAKELFELRSNDEVMRFMDTTKFKSIQDAEKMINNVLDDYKNQKGINWAIIETSTNAFIGYFGFWKMMPEHCRGEIGYALNAGSWGKGYMTETLRVMMRFGFDSIKLHSVEANVNPENINSIKLLEKTGFSKEAHFKENYLFNGKFLDSIIYSLLERNFRNK
jgi:[ribosomal protein S5]-alanine N-acetyltransferase